MIFYVIALLITKKDTFVYKNRIAENHKNWITNQATGDVGLKMLGTSKVK
jgi:hypothetical protein